MQQVIKRTGEMAKVASVLLLTDGQANVGPSSKEAILDAMKNPMKYLVHPTPSPGMRIVPQQRQQRQRFNPFGVST
jgi:hypothetical protein